MNIFQSDIFLLTLTLGAYVLAKYIYGRKKNALLHPLLISTATVIAALVLLDIPYIRYAEANSVLDLGLGMSIVSLGYLLHMNLQAFKGQYLRVLASVTAGSLTSLLSVVGLALLFNVKTVTLLSVLPKSVTAPVAVQLSAGNGGVESITVLAVIITGIFGSAVGPWIFKILKIEDPVAKGLALGTASHAVGTARALEIGVVEGAVGGAAISLTAIATALFLPVLAFFT